jgi:hypothetical protein
MPTDSQSGPYTTVKYTTIDTLLNITLSQWTAGPNLNVIVSFGDGTPGPVFTSITAGSSHTITHAYSSSGSFSISATARPVGLAGVAVVCNTITVHVVVPSNYQCNILF